MALYWGGVSWFQITSGLSGAQRLSSVFELSSTDAWAVDGVTGGFWHWSGQAGLGGGWNMVGSAAVGLNSVFMTGPTDGWAVGSGGVIYRYTGGGWTLYTSVAQTLNSVFFVSQNEGWAVGSGGVIYHYVSGTWTGPISPAPTNQNLNSVFMTDADRWMGGWRRWHNSPILRRRVDAVTEPFRNNPRSEFLIVRGFERLGGWKRWNPHLINQPNPAGHTLSNLRVSIPLQFGGRVDCWLFYGRLWIRGG